MARQPALKRSSRREGTGLTLIDAPWRHTLFDQPKDEGCFLCRAIQDNPHNDPKNLILFRGALAVIILNRYPYTMGALMIAPVEHEGDFIRISDEQLLDTTRLVKRGIKILEAALHPKGYNIGINQGTEAGAGLGNHLHIHLVPRWGADTNFMTTTAGVRVLAEDVDAMYKRLKKALRGLEDG